LFGDLQPPAERQQGMDEVIEKFREMGGEVYVEEYYSSRLMALNGPKHGSVSV